MRGALNELIHSIMEFFKDIDYKLKNVGLMVTEQLGQEKNTLNFNNTHRKDGQDDKY